MSATPNPAPRTFAIMPFHAMELVKRAHALEQQGRSIIHMSIGEPDFGAAPAVVAALATAVGQGHTQYTAALGIAPLRQAIAKFYRDQQGISVDAERIVITAGASGALLLTMAALVAPGDEILMPDPSYPCNRHFIAAFEGRAKLIACGPDTRFQLTAEMVEQHWGPQTRGVLIASPSNPTGTSIEATELKKILAVVAARDGYAIVDEIYQSLSYEGDAASVLTLADARMQERLIVVNSFSKYFNMTGWRLGWLIAPAALVPVFEKLAQNLFICPSAPAQHAALACFGPDTLTLHEQRKAEFHRRRDYIVPALAQLRWGVPVMPDGAFYVYADCSALLDAHIKDSDALALDLLENAGVGVVPGKDFGYHQPERWVRMSYATSMENLQEAIKRMAGWLARRSAAPK